MQLTSEAVANRYFVLQAKTASGPKKVCMLHERCVELLMMARLETDKRRREYLDKAQNILFQLQSSLIIDDSVSQGLFYLYDYSYISLEKGDMSSIVKALVVMTKLKDTFQDLILRI